MGPADLILTGIFLIVAIVLIAVSCIWSKSIRGNCTLEIEAVVEDYGVHYSYHSHRNKRTAIYGYDYHGVHYTASARSGLGTLRIGEKQKIFIDPENPQKCYRKADLLAAKFLMLWGICVVLMLLCITLGTLLK